MRIQILVAGVCAAALLPAAALAQQTCEQRQSTRTVGTLAGAGLGALAGSAVAGRGDRTEGAVLGGLAGAFIGNQVSKGKPDCSRAYGYYDDNGAWHASATPRTNAAGYFDRTGAWVDGAPRGYYASDGRWIQADTDAQTAGYYDSRGLWVPASATGYYTNDGRWVASAAPGHYDRSGRWVAGPATGRYDANGVWIAGEASGRRDANGRWIADPQPGYYRDGRWVRGEAMGYYDARGRWISTDNRQSQGGYRSADGMQSIDERQADLDRQIRMGMDNRSLSRADGDRLLRSLATIEREERSLRNRQGNLGPRGQATITARLDSVTNSLNRMSRDRRNDRYGSR